MQITTSWKQEGIEEGEKSLILLLIKHKLGNISPSLQNQIMGLNIDEIETLGESLFDFSTVDDLVNWLDNNQ